MISFSFRPAASAAPSGTTPVSYTHLDVYKRQAVGGGIDGFVKALYSYSGELYAGGEFTTAGGITATNTAKWNGTS